MLRFKGWVRFFSVKLLRVRSGDGMSEPGPGETYMTPLESSHKKTAWKKLSRKGRGGL